MSATDLTLLGAFLGGLVSFLSPCVLPVIPAYVSVVTGLSVTSVQQGGRAHLAQVLKTSLGFVAGFSAVFVLLGLSVTAVGGTLLENRSLLTRLSGLVVLAMALFLLASLVLKAPWLYQEKRWHPSLDRFGPFAAPVAGVAFGFGWTPCIGPVLTSILAIAAGTGELGRGAGMLVAYSVGLAVPFLAAALALDRMAGAFGFVSGTSRPHGRPRSCSPVRRPPGTRPDVAGHHGHPVPAPARRARRPARAGLTPSSSRTPYGPRRQRDRR
ncbi:MAG: cytochrome c biogenesis protein CcdA [Nocardioides sp.]